MFDDDDPEEAVERALDAEDRTLYRMWRHRVLGNTVARVIAMGRVAHAVVQLRVPAAEHAIVARTVRDNGIAMAAFLRRAIASELIHGYGVSPDDIPWLGKDGWR